MGRKRAIEDDALLAIAREVFVREGAFASTRDIARRAGISEATLFKRFPTKAKLFISAMAPPVIDADALIAKAEALNDARKGLAVIAEGVLGFFREALPVILPLLRNPLIPADAVHNHFGHDQAGKLTGAIASYLRKQAQLGRIGTAPPFAAAALVVTSAHSIALFELMGFHGGTIPPQGQRALLDTLWTGLTPRKAATTPRRKTR